MLKRSFAISFIAAADKGELEAHDDPTFVKCPAACNNNPPKNSGSCEEQVSTRDSSTSAICCFSHCSMESQLKLLDTLIMVCQRKPMENVTDPGCKATVNAPVESALHSQSNMKLSSRKRRLGGWLAHVMERRELL